MRRLLAGVACLACLVPAAAAEPPRVAEAPPAEYPAWARGAGVGTEVELRVLVGRDGRVREVRVVPYNVRHDILTREMRASFDSAAVRAVHGWTFHPATREGEPVPAWTLVRVPFLDPADDGAGVPSPPPIDESDVEYVTRFPQAVDRETPEWPAAARYVCRGQVVVQVGVDAAGRVRAARVSQRLYTCPDSLLAAAVDSAAVRAAWGWRYTPAEIRDRPTEVAIPVAFRIPDPPEGEHVVVGCVRDSASGRLWAGAEIWGSEPRTLGLTDDTGWFVLKGTALRQPMLRAHRVCRAGGFQPVRPWKRPGDEITLRLSGGRCKDEKL